MLIQAVEIGVVVVVFAAPWALLALAGRAERARNEVVERQIAVTDAIHRELGPVVAPVVTRRGRNAWEIAMATPLDRPVTTGRLLVIAHDALIAPDAREARDGAGTPEVSFVLTSRGARR
jgi:hypothetical protein